MKVAIISFSRSGYRLSEMIYWVLKERDYEVTSYTKSKYTKKILDESQLDEESRDFRNTRMFSSPVDESMKEWTKRRFEDSDAIVLLAPAALQSGVSRPLLRVKK